MQRRWIAIGVLAVIGSVEYQRHNDKEAETDPAQAGSAAALDKYDPAKMKFGAPPATVTAPPGTAKDPEETYSASRSRNAPPLPRAGAH